VKRARSVSLWCDRRLEEVTRELERVKRAKSHHEDPLSPESSAQSMTPPSNDRFGTQIDAASAFGLNGLDAEYSQVARQMLGNYQLSGADIAALFRKYELLLLLPYYGSHGLVLQLIISPIFQSWTPECPSTYYSKLTHFYSGLLS
jgi:hypothetical protein